MLMSKSSYPYITLFLLYFLLHGNTGSAQLTIDAGTKWVSSSDTYAVLDGLGMQYNADPALLNNVFRFTGTGNVYIGGNFQPLFNVINVAKEGAAQLFLGRDIGVLNSVQFQTGLFDLHTRNLYLSPGAVLSNEMEASRFVAPNGGTVNITVNLTNPVSVNPGYLGAVVTAAGNLGAVTVSRGHVPQNINGSKSIARYYQVSAAGNSHLNATLRFYYLNAEKNALQEDSLVTWQSNNSINWSSIGFTARDTVNNYVEKTGIDSLSFFTLYKADVLLPVQGLQLSGAWNNNSSMLFWTTLAEYNNDHFDVQRKYANENDFSTITAVPSRHPGGNSSLPTLYAYTDATPVSTLGDILYRLKQVDVNGQYTYSNTIVIKPAAGATFIYKTFPTIVKANSVYIQAGNVNLQKMQVMVVDMHGRKLMNAVLPYQSQWLTLPFVSQGMYRLVIEWGEWKYSSTFVK